MNRVVITGLGAVTALGLDAHATWQAVKQAVSNFHPYDLSVPGRAFDKPVASIPNFNPKPYLSDKRLMRMDRYCQMLMVASQQAVNDAGIDFSGELGEQTAVITGTGLGGTGSFDNLVKRFYMDPASRVNPASVLLVDPSSGTSNLTLEFGITGPAFTVGSACSSSSHAIGQAFSLVRSGTVSAAITGGSEALLTNASMPAWEALGMLAKESCRPFSRDREGTILGEGAAVLILESEQHAKDRNAQIYCELSGFGMSADAYHPVKPSRKGMASAMEAALRLAELDPVDINYINAHGTGTHLNDSTETGAIHDVFSDHAHSLAVSSTKSMHGHTLGASGAIEMLLCAKAIQESVIPPTANWLGSDHACDLDYVPNEARDGIITAALCNSFAFGGLNSVLALKRMH